MPTITKAAIQYIQDELEEVTGQRDELEDELIAALEENANLKLEIQRLRADREMVV